MPSVFLDTNILLRHLLGDHPEQSPRATTYLQRVENGEILAHVADTVVFECVFTLERYYKQPRDRIRDAILPLLELRGIILPGKQRYRRVFDIYIDHNLSFADAYHATLAAHLKLDEIISFDRGLDRIPGVKRREP